MYKGTQLAIINGVPVVPVSLDLSRESTMRDGGGQLLPSPWDITGTIEFFDMERRYVHGPNQSIYYYTGEIEVVLQEVIHNEIERYPSANGRMITRSEFGAGYAKTEERNL